MYCLVLCWHQDNAVLKRASGVFTRAEGGSLFAQYDTIERDLTFALQLVEKHTDPMVMRDEFYEFFEGGGYFNYGQGQANEIVSKGLGVFAITRGDVRAAIVTAVNFGRDTDCLGAVAGGLAGECFPGGCIPARLPRASKGARAHDHASVEVSWVHRRVEVGVGLHGQANVAV